MTTELGHANTIDDLKSREMLLTELGVMRMALARAIEWVEIMQERLRRAATEERESCARIVDAMVARCEREIAASDDAEDRISLRNLSWQFSNLADSIRNHGNHIPHAPENRIRN